MFVTYQPGLVLGMQPKIDDINFPHVLNCATGLGSVTVLWSVDVPGLVKDSG